MFLKQTTEVHHNYNLKNLDTNFTNFHKFIRVLKILAENHLL